METHPKCDLCDQEFECIYDGDPFGYGCASRVNGDGIRCYFGSNKDLNQYSWVGGSIPSHLNGVKNICDDCIDKLEVDKVIVFAGEYNPLNGIVYK